MKELNLYILEKLKIDKTSKVSGDKKGHYGIHDNKAVDKILYLSTIKDTNAIIERAVEEWVEEYNVLDVEGYSYDKAMNALNLPSEIRGKLNPMNEEPLLDYYKNKCNLLYDNNKIVIRADGKCIIFVFKERGKIISAIAFRKY